MMSEDRMPWRRGLAWTLALGVLTWVSTWLIPWLSARGLPDFLAIAPSMIGALLIGVRLRSWRWVVLALLVGAPLAAVGLLFLAMGATSPTDQPGPMGPGGGRLFALDLGEVLFVLGATLAVCHAASAAVGVWWGKRRAVAGGFLDDSRGV